MNVEGEAGIIPDPTDTQIFGTSAMAVDRIRDWIEMARSQPVRAIMFVGVVEGEDAGAVFVAGTVGDLAILIGVIDDEIGKLVER